MMLFNQAYFNQSWGLWMLLALVDLVLRGYALWIAGGKRRMWWFIALLVINSMGILPLIYLLVIEKGEAKKVLKKVKGK